MWWWLSKLLLELQVLPCLLESNTAWATTAELRHWWPPPSKLTYHLPCNPPYFTDSKKHTIFHLIISSIRTEIKSALLLLHGWDKQHPREDLTVKPLFYPHTRVQEPPGCMVRDCAPGRRREKPRSAISQLHQYSYRDPSWWEGGWGTPQELRELLKGLHKQNKTKIPSDKEALSHHVNGQWYFFQCSGSQSWWHNGITWGVV